MCSLMVFNSFWIRGLFERQSRRTVPNVRDARFSVELILDLLRAPPGEGTVLAGISLGFDVDA